MARTDTRTLRRLGRVAAGDPLRMYCVGIGGTGLSGLALVAHQLGHQVSGSDKSPSKHTRFLSELGIEINFDQDGSQIDSEIQLVVCTAAVTHEHPEIARALALGLPVVKYAEALGAVAGARETIAIAGTHGKTTTSSLAAFTLQRSGLEPSFVIGGVIPQLGGSAGVDNGADMVIEACEYDRSFLAFSPRTAVILNIEEDHFDCFNGLTDLLETFIAFAVRIKHRGSLIVNGDCENTARVVAAVRAVRPDLEILRFGRSDGVEIRATEVTLEDGRPRFTLQFKGQIVGRVALEVPGEHSVMNAMAAIAAATRTGLGWARAIAALSEFEGVQRRFTILHESPAAVIVDDYAHHPTAVRAVLAAARKRFPKRRIVAVFEPHQHNRTLRLFDEFASAFVEADRVLLTDIYRCRDADADVRAVDSKRLATAIQAASPKTEAQAVGDHASMLKVVATLQQDGDALIFMGAGQISAAAQSFTESFASELRSRVSARMESAVAPIQAACAASSRFSRDIIPSMASNLERVLSRELGAMLRLNEDLSKHVTFRAGGLARFFVEPRSLTELVEAVALLRRHGIAFEVLGGGSNVIFRDGVFNGAVIATRRLERLELRPDGLYGECGVHLQRLLHRAEQGGFAGLEDLAGIPARLGGAVAMNCGGPPGAPAVGDFVKRVLVLEANGRLEWIKGPDAGFGYRHSQLSGKVVLAAELSGFAPEPPSAIRARRFASAQRKASVQPLAAASAGCIFRNPEGMSAGRLIDELGLKGSSRGPALVSEQHGNFIVNRKGASTADILDLVNHVQEQVFEKTGRRLELELQVKG